MDDFLCTLFLGVMAILLVLGIHVYTDYQQTRVDKIEAQREADEKAPASKLVTVVEK